MARKAQLDLPVLLEVLVLLALLERKVARDQLVLLVVKALQVLLARLALLAHRG